MNVIIKKSARAKRWRLSIDRASQVVLTTPKRFDTKEAELIIQTHKEWIETITNRQKLASNQIKYIYDSHSPLLPLLGEWIEIDNPEGFYKKYAREYFHKTSQELAEILGVSYKKITIRDQKTRLGSYSSSGTLSFNWRVIKAPEFVAHYLVAHEVAHIRHPNHGAKFWQTVATLAPRYKEANLWLKSNIYFLRFDPWS